VSSFPPVNYSLFPKRKPKLNKRAGVFHECFPEEKHLHLRSQLQTKADVNRAHKKLLPLTKNITSDRFNFFLKLSRPTLSSCGAMSGPARTARRTCPRRGCRTGRCRRTGIDSMNLLRPVFTDKLKNRVQYNGFVVIHT
jgi:hypothetical protein